MCKIYNSIPARFAQADLTKNPELLPRLSSPHDLQARKLCRRFGLSPETSRTIAYLINPGARS